MDLKCKSITQINSIESLHVIHFMILSISTLKEKKNARLKNSPVYAFQHLIHRTFHNTVMKIKRNHLSQCIKITCVHIMITFEILHVMKADLGAMHRWEIKE